MADFSAGYYDLSITNYDSQIPLTTDERTVKTVVEYFFSTELGQNSGLLINDYGHDYILGFKQKPHVYDCEKAAKKVNRVMVGKSTSDTMPNALPSEKNYGFKSNLKFPIFSKEIESFKVFPVPVTLESSKKKGKLHNTDLLYTPTDKPFSTTVLKPTYVRKARGKHTADELQDNALKPYLGYKGRQTTKTTIKSGGRSKEFTNLDNVAAYASRTYKIPKSKHSLISGVMQFSVTEDGVIWIQENNDPKKRIAQIIVNAMGDNVVSPISSIPATDKRKMELFTLATQYAKTAKVNEIKDTLILTDVKDILKAQRKARRKAQRRNAAIQRKLDKRYSVG